MTDEPRYYERKLGSTVKDVLDAFYNHPGLMEKRCYAFDVHQGFRVSVDRDRQLVRHVDAGVIPLTEDQITEFEKNVAAGAVEVFLQRPAWGTEPYPVAPKVVIHGATGTPIPYDNPETGDPES